MSDTVREASGPAPDTDDVVGRLSTHDRLLPAWIGLAMALGLPIGRGLPGLDEALASVEVGTVSLPIALGCW